MSLERVAQHEEYLLNEVKWQWATLVLEWVTVGALDQLWGVSQFPELRKF